MGQRRDLVSAGSKPSTASRTDGWYGRAGVSRRDCCARRGAVGGDSDGLVRYWRVLRGRCSLGPARTSKQVTSPWRVIVRWVLWRAFHSGLSAGLVRPHMAYLLVKGVVGPRIASSWHDKPTWILWRGRSGEIGGTLCKRLLGGTLLVFADGGVDPV